MFYAPITAAPGTWIALVLWLVDHADDLRHAAYVLGGPNADARTARLLRDAMEAPEPTRRLVRMLLELHDLLSLEHADDPDRIEARCFAAIDPASPVAMEICLLTDGLADHLAGLRAANPGLFVPRAVAA